MSDYILSCESTVDLSADYLKSREIEVIKYTYVMDGKVFEDDMGKDGERIPEFYGNLKAGKFASTTLINQQEYKDYFMNLLERSDKVLHIAFGSGLSGSVANAIKVADLINESHPDKKIVVVDSLSGSSGYGLLLEMVAERRDEGKSLAEQEEWIKANRLNIHHYIFTTDLFYFKRGGRISMTEAIVGELLHIRPMIYMGTDGKLRVFTKLRGRKRVFKKDVHLIEEHTIEGKEYSGKCFISHANAKADAEELRDTIEEEFKNLKGKVKIFDVGPVIGSHTGQGAVGLFFFGKKRVDFETMTE